MIKILTNHPGQNESPTWKNVSTYFPFVGNNTFRAVKVGFRLFIHQWQHDCVVIGASRSDVVYALLSALLPKSLRRPCIMIDCLWYEESTMFKRVFKKLQMRVMDRAIDKYLVWARREIKAYSKAFNLPRKKFLFVPYHTTLDTCEFEINEGQYLFSGGNFDRDYSMLVEAVRPLNVNLIIATTRPELFENIELPQNMKVQGFSHIEYIKKMANCKLNIVPLASGLLHSGGQQTFLNSMFLSKPTIVTDPEGAVDYIDNRKNGLLSPQDDPEKLRKNIEYLLDNPQIANEIGRQAKIKAKEYSTEQHFKIIIAIAEELVKG